MAGGGNNAYLNSLHARDVANRAAARQTYEQFMTDMFIFTLNDPAYMDKDVFGYTRLKRVLAGVGHYYDMFFDALGGGAEADYAREKMDERMKQIVKNHGPFIPFEDRYDYVLDVSTSKPTKAQKPQQIKPKKSKKKKKK